MQPGLSKLVKNNTLSGLLTEIETLSGKQLFLQVHDLDGKLVAGSSLAPDPSSSTNHTRQQLFSRAIMMNGQPVGKLVAQMPVGIQDMSSSSDTFPLLDAATRLLEHFLAQQIEKRALVEETLERYREINLLYNIQEAIGARLDVQQIAQLVLRESLRVIKATTGVLLLLVHEDRSFQLLAQHGDALLENSFPFSDSIAGWVVQQSQPVILNDVASDTRSGSVDRKARSLLCVPLATGETSIGALTLYDKLAGDFFTAGDQKLLTTLAAPAAIAIETAREVKARESRLKAKIRELRIEIDEIRKKKQVASVTTTDYFARLQQDADELRREFEKEI